MSSISLGGDVLAVSDHDVLGPAGDGEVATVDPATEVAGAEIAVGIKGAGVVFRVQVAQQHLWASRADLAVDDDDVGDSRTTIGLGGMVEVIRCADGHDRNLGRAVHAGHHRLVEIVAAVRISAGGTERRHR